jgi:hypothetical protein
MRYDCVAPGCSASFRRSDKYVEHHRDNTTHPCKAKNCPHAAKAKVVVTAAWTALGCGFCETLFALDPSASTTNYLTMKTTHNDYMNHLISHYDAGMTRDDWSTDCQIRSLLLQQHIRARWSRLCINEFETADPSLWPTLHWDEEGAKSFIEMLEAGQIYISPSANLRHFLQASKDQHTSYQLQHQGFPLVLDASIGVRSVPWYGPMVTGFDIDPDLMSITAGTSVLASTLVDGHESLSVQLDTTAYTSSRGLQDYAIVPDSPAQSFDWSTNVPPHETALAGAQDFGGDISMQCETSPMPFDLAPDNGQNSSWSDEGPATQPVSFDHAKSDGPDRLFVPTAPMVDTNDGSLSSTAYNTTTPIPEGTWSKRSKRPLSSVSAHVKRLSRHLFHN